MEVATATPSNGGMPPFHDHDVREWSTLDSITGVLERARVETDHWAANTNNTSHKYGKVVDSRARTDAGGALRQQARRQLEVFQSQIPGGQLQVIKTHSVSSSRWTNKQPHDLNGATNGEFEGFQIPSSPLDLSFQKSKAVIGRSAARRPPSRIKNREETSPTKQNAFNDFHGIASTNLQRVTRLCHQVHENAVKQAFGNYTNRPAIAERLNSFDTNDKKDEDNSVPKQETPKTNGIHTNLSRTKSSSSEDFLVNPTNDKNTKCVEDLEALEQLQTWRRSSKIRRSLQHPKQDKTVLNKPIDLPESSVSVRKITEEFEKGRRLSTALRGNSIDLQTLDQILQTISSSSSDKTSIADEELDKVKEESLKNKRHSFVTVESLQEIKGRLRRTSTPERDTFKDIKEHDVDDGIVTEDNMIDVHKFPQQSKVRSYVYGMETALTKPSVNTGSLESRSKLSNGTSNRNEDWYNRRKSYGFEPVQNQSQSMPSNRNIVESSTDSGICRSSEVIVIPTVIKNSEDMPPVSSTDPSFGNVRKISSLFDNKSDSVFRKDAWNRRNDDWNSGIRIKIPITSDSSWESPEKEVKRHSIAVDEMKYVSQNKNDNEARRTSLVINENFSNVPVTFDNGDFNKKLKRVEFCKTEVHFAAESGKVNIVETDEKPPPTQNFRRRRRNSNSLNYLNDFNRNGLPVLHFGENFAEKPLFANGNNQYSEETYSSEENEGGSTKTTISHGVVTVNSDFNGVGVCDDEKRESENESIKGILKNKIAKPKPYHLGENLLNFHIFDDKDSVWGSEKSTPVWKSTVQVSNTLFSGDTRGDSKVFQGLDPNNQPDLIKDQLKKMVGYQSDFARSDGSERMRPFLSVADRIKCMELENQKVDSHRGYSTRVNIGDGKAIVVENNGVTKSDYYPDHIKPEVKDSRIFEKAEPAKHIDEEPVRIKAQIKNRKYSPIVLRKHPVAVKTVELKSANSSEKLSSPLLVGKSYTENRVVEIPVHKEAIRKEKEDTKVAESKSKDTFVKTDKVLRQPDRSELAYFGIKVQPPDNLLRSNTFTREVKVSKKSTRETKTSDSPIYENLTPDLTLTKPTKEFDSGILEELTKAADEILQAVKDYSEEETRKQKEEEKKIELSTITENKSWKHQEKVSKPVDRPCKSKLRNASSNSSLDTSPKDGKQTQRYISNTKASADKIRSKATGSDSGGLKATTKARRLQRASSREALLQSHGSSSEDLAVNEVPLRKPRLVRKTKTTQLTMTNGIEISKKPTASTSAKKKTDPSTKTKIEDRLPNALPEIRHKTAVSTIRSTTERSTRDRTKHRPEDSRKKAAQQKEVSKAPSPTSTTNPLRSKRETVTHRLATANIKKYRPEKH